jgi:hypothetical protein
VLEVCEGLSEAHALSLVHRDIKPANLFLSRRPDGRPLVKILDFGIAKRLADKRRRSLTNPARSLGSPWYMSPEQMMDPSRVDARSDIWSLGVLLFELLTNDHPFDGEGVPEVCAKVLNAPTPSLREYRRDIDPELEVIVRRCLEKNPDDRFQDVGSLSDSLLEFAPLEEVSPSQLPGPRSGRRRRVSRPTLGSLAPFAHRPGRRRALWSNVATALLVAVVGGSITWGVVAHGRDMTLPTSGAEASDRIEAWAKRLRLPGDPVLGPGPTPAPLERRREFVRAPTAPVLTEKSERPTVGVVAPASAGHAALTPAEVEERASRYEAWLRAQGLERVSDVIADGNNPY